MGGGEGREPAGGRQPWRWTSGPPDPGPAWDEPVGGSGRPFYLPSAHSLLTRFTAPSVLLITPLRACGPEATAPARPALGALSLTATSVTVTGAATLLLGAVTATLLLGAVTVPSL